MRHHEKSIFPDVFAIYCDYFAV